MKSHHQKMLQSNILNVITVISAVIFPATSAQAQWEGGFNAGDVNVSGHFDVQAVGRNAELGNNDFAIGQFALDLSSNLSQRVTTAMEIAYGHDEQVEIDEAFIDWTLYQWDGEPREKTIGSVSMGVRAGQFDVPFGLDWRSYSSLDRPLVSVPLVIANTHRGWNDLGIEAHGELTWANWTVFAVNGFGTSSTLRLPDRPQSVDLTADANSDDVVPTEAFGARFGLVMNEHLEFGTSFAGGYTDDNDQDERLFGVDFTGQTEGLELKAEFINHQRNRMNSKETVFGYYVQGRYDVNDRWFGVVRGDSFNGNGTEVYPFNASMKTLFCGSAGAGYRVGTNAQCRVEYQLAEGTNNDTVFLQTAVGF